MLFLHRHVPRPHRRHSQRHARPPRPARLDGRVHALQAAAAREPAARGRRDPERRRRRATVGAAAGRGRAAVVLARSVRPDRLAACQDPWPPQPRERAGRGVRGRGGRRDRGHTRPCAARVRRTAQPARARRRARRRAVRQRLQGDQPGGGDDGPDRLRRADAADPGRIAQGRLVDPLAAAVADAPVAGVYLIGDSTDAIAAALDARSVPTAAAATWPPPSPVPPPRPSPATSCCSRPPAPLSTSSHDYEQRGEVFLSLSAEVLVGG